MRKLALALTLLLSLAALADDTKQQPYAPDRRPGEGDGPYDRLVIRGAMLIDGTGAPPQGLVDIVIEKNRITEIRSVGFPHVAIKAEDRPKGGSKEIDASLMYVLPGLIDM